MAFIVDASMAAAWILPDEFTPAADLVLQQLLGESALTPSLFWHETRNIVLMAERRGRIASGEAVLTIGRLRRLPIEDAGSGHDATILGLAIKHTLSAYDAALSGPGSNPVVATRNA